MVGILFPKWVVNLLLEMPNCFSKKQSIILDLLTPFHFLIASPKLETASCGPFVPYDVINGFFLIKRVPPPQKKK